MPEFLRAYRAQNTDPTGDGPIDFIASTEGIKRDGQDLKADDWYLDRFRSNPVFLWGHDYFGSRLPIGRTDVEVVGKELHARVTFDRDDPFAREVERKYRNGFLHTVSVGWETIEDPSGQRAADGRPRIVHGLLDLSGVPVPGDWDALKRAQSRNLKLMAREILDELEPSESEPEPPTQATTEPIATTAPPDTSARATWDVIAPQMVRLMTPFAQRPDDERKADWQRLVREYERLRKTPPEFITQSDLDALGVDEVRGVFLEGEPESFAAVFDAITTRAGAVLSQRNRSDLDQAIALITGVLERSTSTKPDDEPTDDERAAMVLLQDLANGIAGVQA